MFSNLALFTLQTEFLYNRIQCCVEGNKTLYRCPSSANIRERKGSEDIYRHLVESTFCFC